MKLLKTFEENIQKLNEVRENIYSECMVEHPPVPCDDCPYMWQGACLMNILGDIIYDAQYYKNEVIEETTNA
jgi:hypothetical protein